MSLTVLTQEEPDSHPPLLHGFSCMSWLMRCATEDKASGGTTPLSSHPPTHLLNSLSCSMQVHPELLFAFPNCCKTVYFNKSVFLDLKGLCPVFEFWHCQGNTQSEALSLLAGQPDVGVVGAHISPVNESHLKHCH